MVKRGYFGSGGVVGIGDGGVGGEVGGAVVGVGDNVGVGTVTTSSPSVEGDKAVKVRVDVSFCQLQELSDALNERSGYSPSLPMSPYTNA